MTVLLDGNVLLRAYCSRVSLAVFGLDSAFPDIELSELIYDLKREFREIKTLLTECCTQLLSAHSTSSDLAQTPWSRNIQLLMAKGNIVEEEDLAVRTGISITTIKAYLRDPSRKPNSWKLQQVANALSAACGLKIAAKDLLNPELNIDLLPPL